MPTQHGRGERRQREAVGVKPAGVRQIDDAEAVEEFGERVAAERDEAPEHERVREAGERPLPDRPPLQQDVDEEAAWSGSRGGRGRRCCGAAAISWTRRATCAAKAPRKDRNRSQNARVAIH